MHDFICRLTGSLDSLTDVSSSKMNNSFPGKNLTCLIMLFNIIYAACSNCNFMGTQLLQEKQNAADAWNSVRYVLFLCWRILRGGVDYFPLDGLGIIRHST